MVCVGRGICLPHELRFYVEFIFQSNLFLLKTGFVTAPPPPPPPPGNPTVPEAAVTSPEATAAAVPGSGFSSCRHALDNRGNPHIRAHSLIYFNGNA